MKIPAFVVYDTYTSLAMQNLQADHSVAHVIHEDWVCPMDFKWFSKVRDGPRHKLLQTIHRGNQDSNSKPTVPFWFDSNDDKWLGANLEVTEVQEKWYKEGWDQNQGRVGRGIPGPARAKNRQACCRGLGWRPTAQTDRSPGRECSVCSPHPHRTLSTWRCHRFQLRYVKPVNTLCAKKQRRFSVDANCSTDCGRALDSLS